MIIACEPTADGWRALMQTGDVLEVTADKMPSEVLLHCESYTLPAPSTGLIANYRERANRCVELFKQNQFEQALNEIEAVIEIAPTTRALLNRAFIQLSLGQWPEGFADYELRLEFRPFMGAPKWNGENIAGKRLVLVHDLGFGDTIQMLRYVPALFEMGAQVWLQMPAALQRLAGQLAPLGSDGDFYCPIMSLLHILQQTQENIPREPYLCADPALVERWKQRIGPRRDEPRIGIAWDVGQQVAGDYPRSIPLEMFRQAFPDEQLFSLQSQGRDDARALGIEAHDFEDFADCAALMMLMDEIVVIDTAALHLAGALGHPRVAALLSHWASWRWQAQWYPQVRFFQQDKPGDWASAFAKLCAP